MLSNHPSVLGSGAAGVTTPAAASSALDLISTTQGAVLYRNASAWTALTPGTSGQLLSTQGAAANPIWVTATGGAGDFNGPASSTDNAMVRFDGTGGKTAQNSAVTVSDVATNNVTVAATTGNSLTSQGGDSGASLALGSGANGAATFNRNLLIGTSSDFHVGDGGDPSLLNCFIGGHGSGYPGADNTTGHSIVAVGTEAARSNSTGYDITAVGKSAARIGVSAIRTTAGGRASLYSNTGDDNAAWGAYALTNAGAITGMTALGNYAGFTPTGGSNSIFIGFNAGNHASQKVAPVNQIVIGSNQYSTADNQTVIGNSGTTSTVIYGAITGGSIQNMPIGDTTRNSGAFTTLAANGATTLTAGLTVSGALTTLTRTGAAAAISTAPVAKLLNAQGDGNWVTMHFGGAVSDGYVGFLDSATAATRVLAFANQGTVRQEINGSGAVRFNAYGAGTLTTDSSGNITATSDARAKNITGDFTTGLSAIRKLSPKFYTWKKETGLNTSDINVSLIAQDLIAAGLSEAVNTQRTVEEMDSVTTTEPNGRRRTIESTKRDGNGRAMTRKVETTYTVNDRAILAALVNAIKEMDARIEKIESK